MGSPYRLSNIQALAIIIFPSNTPSLTRTQTGKEHKPNSTACLPFATPLHNEQILLRSNPVALQEAHSSQSAMLVALWFIPWQRSPPMILLQRPSATVALYPAAPHSVQQVFGNSLFRARRQLLAKRGHILPEGSMATSAPTELFWK
jgi:hypothetical protein